MSQSSSFSPHDPTTISGEQEKSKVFTYEDQTFFGEASGDVNSIHFDKETVRKSKFLGVLVHGIHQLFWAMDNVSDMVPAGKQIVALNVTFKQPVIVGANVHLNVIRRTKTMIDLEICDDEVICTTVSLTLGKGLELSVHATEQELQIEKRSTARLDCAILKRQAFLDENLEKSREVATRYRRLTRCLSLRQIKVLSDCSYCVGMECPGEYSIFQSLSLSWVHDVDMAVFSTLELDERVPLVEIEVFSHGGLSGRVKTTKRQPVVRQQNFQYFQENVAANKFAGWYSLVVGGSRGLGEVTAKAISAGGGKTMVTYNKGKEDATLLRGDLGCEIAQYDAVAGSLELGSFEPTNLLFFATPKVVPELTQVESRKAYEIFEEVYVRGLIRTIRSLKKPVHVFFPSTSFIDKPKPQFNAYTESKLAAENVLYRLQQEQVILSFYAPRLPVLATDLSSTFYNSDTKTTADNMTEHLVRWSNELGSLT